MDFLAFHSVFICKGFRLESRVYPLLHEKASEGQYYTQTQVRGLVQYAR